MPFTQEYLKDYEEKIRKLPLEELYDILSLIRDDPFKADDSPERVKIVENRIRELDLIPTEELNNKLEEEFQKKPHPKSSALAAIGLILALFGFILLASRTEKGLQCAMLFWSLAFFCYAGSSLMDKRVTLQYGSFAHKRAHPVLFWVVVISEIAIGIWGIIDTIVKL
ncbi:hypothetical protein [Fibrobacter sp.]|uniref:hypothetical protein n=1 Tax=Fibrobacter sp. TaxID=35828 RepID=UPI0025C1D7F9|nr:hypothetical protein [Fibrobacter sp.]MBR3072723.1 hypothetical protein [Fibrobacter sp.]